VLDLAGRNDADHLLDVLYREILVPSFRQEELDPLPVIAAAFAEDPPLLDIAAARDAAGEIVGAMVCEWSPSTGVYLLSYLAARPGLRSRGVGTALMRHLPVWSRARGAVVTLAEVDDPRCHGDEGLVGEPAARLAFYGRFGARVLDLPYFQPGLAGGRRAHGMLLLAFDVDPAGLAPGSVPALRGDLLGRWLREYFAGSEHVPGREEGAGDPDLARLLHQASATAGVRLLPLERYTDVTPDAESGRS
jgi:GNAT superfamily N-acetyltransferase